MIADDGSEPGQILQLLESLRQMNCEFKLATQNDAGFQLARSRNNAIRCADAELLIFLDGDCLPERGFVLHHIKRHNEMMPGSVVIGSRKHVPSYESKFGGAGSVKEISISKENATIEQAMLSADPWRGLLGRNFSIRIPQAQSTAPLFDESIYGWGFEDLDFGILLLRLGYTFSFQQPAIVTEHIAEASASRNPYINPTCSNVLLTQANCFYLLEKYRDDESISSMFLEFLIYYYEPFEIDMESGNVFANADLMERFSNRYDETMRSLRPDDPKGYIKQALERHLLLQKKCLLLKSDLEMHPFIRELIA